MDEPPLVFVERWTAQLRALQAGLQGAASDAAIKQRIVQELSKELTERAADLPAFELRRCEKELTALQDELVASIAAAAPKSKFSFKRGAPSASASTSARSARQPAARTSAPSLPASRPIASPVPPTAMILSSHSSTHLTASSLPSPPTSSPSGGALALSSLSSCLVDLRAPTAGGSRGTFSALYLTDLRRCVVLLPREAGASALVQGCEACVIALGAHQFRMHDSTGCAVLLDAGSTPVIERCKGLAFGRYPAALPGGDGELASSSQDAARATLPQVQDFDDPFATPERPSPNWRALSTAEQAALSGALAPLDVVGETGNAWEAVRDRAVQLLDAGEQS